MEDGPIGIGFLIELMGPDGTPARAKAMARILKMQGVKSRYELSALGDEKFRALIPEAITLGVQYEGRPRHG